MQVIGRFEGENWSKYGVISREKKSVLLRIVWKVKYNLAKALLRGLVQNGGLRKPSLSGDKEYHGRHALIWSSNCWDFLLVEKVWRETEGHDSTRHRW